MHRVRRTMPFDLGGLDISPIIIIFAIIFLQKFVAGSLMIWAGKMM